MSVASIDAAFADERPRLVAIAYRMLGSVHDAEDVVQEAMARAHRAEPGSIDSPAAFLTTVTTRLAIDHLRSARVRRESYVGPWLPEPVVSAADGGDPGSVAELADSLSLGFLVLLEALGPEERAVLLLHDVFGHRHADIAAILGRTEAGSRQLLSRARRRVQGGGRRAEVDPGRHEELVRRFRDACEGGDMDAFLALLTDDVVLVSDGGADRKAARHPIRGADRVGRLLAYVMGRARERRRFLPVTVNGRPGLAALDRGRLYGIFDIEPGAGGRAATIHWVVNPDKIAHLAPELEAAAARSAESS